MRLIGKLLALPFVLVTGILYLVCKFLVVVSGAVLGILSGIVFLAALALFFAAGFWPGLSWLVIAFLISPYGLPMAAAWLYFHSATYAHEHGELDQYRASHKANIACKEAIEQAIADNYRDNRLGPACVQQVLQQFDPGRIFYVLANTVRQKEHDGRISRDNKAWAQTIPVCEDKDGFGYDRNVSFVVDRSHPGLMDLFLTQARDIAKEDFKMNQEFMSRNQVEFIRQTYPPNTRILLQHMDDPYAPVPAGTRGTVKYVDDIGQIGVAWDNGRSLSLIPGMDTYRKLTQQELTQEQGEKPSIHDSLGKHAAHSDKPKMKKEQTR